MTNTTKGAAGVVLFAGVLCGNPLQPNVGDESADGATNGSLTLIVMARQ